MDIKAIEEFRISGNLYIGGSMVEGAWTTTSGTDCLVRRDVLMELLSTKEDHIRLQKIHSHMQKMIVDGALQTGGSADKKELETARKPDMSEIRALSADVRAKKRDRSFALTLSLSIRGYGNSRIVQELGNEGYGTSKASIARALSVTKEGDRQRIKDIMALHPECFEGISEGDFEKWFSKRYEKLTKAAKIREENSSWGS